MGVSRRAAPTVVPATAVTNWLSGPGWSCQPDQLLPSRGDRRGIQPPLDRGVASVHTRLCEPDRASGPLGSSWPAEQPDLILPVRSNGEHLVTARFRLIRRKPEHLAGRSMNLHLPAIPECQQRSFHRDSFPRGGRSSPPLSYRGVGQARRAPLTARPPWPFRGSRLNSQRWRGWRAASPAMTLRRSLSWPWCTPEKQRELSASVRDSMQR